MISREVVSQPFWSFTKEKALEILETTEVGLTTIEADRRRKIFGRNVIAERRRLTRVRILLNQFLNPLIILLLIASGITIALGSWKDALFIGLAAILNALMGFYQENKAESALARLKVYIEDRVRVFRDGREVELAAETLIPGDVVHLTQGSRVPADCRLIYANDLSVDEAILTGEALPADKNESPVPLEAALGDQRSCVFRGTLVAEGFGNAVVMKTGGDTELGRIASFIAEDHAGQTTPLRRAISSFSVKVSVFLLFFTAALFAIGVSRGTPVFEMFLTSVAVIVSAVPEGLPIAITVILAIGVERLARKQGIVRRLLAAETLGNTSVILTDKTGTLTEAKIELTKIAVSGAAREKGYSESELLFHALTNTDAIVENPGDHFRAWRIVGRPIENALILGAAKKDVRVSEVKESSELLDYLPFTSKNKFSASVIRRGDRYFVNVLGAPEIIIEFTSLNDGEKAVEKKKIAELAGKGERVLGVAVKEINRREEEFLRAPEALQNLLFLGTLSFRDPVREGVKEAIREIHDAGVRTVIVTGDHRGTAVSVASELGFALDDQSVIEGSELDELSDTELKDRIENLQVVARVSPEGKVRIAKAFQEAGEIVAMTGDGVNDAASLKEANIGVAMGSGTDIAKDVADLVLLNDNFETIVAAIGEGRRILQNIKRVIVYLLYGVFNELLLIGGALFMGFVIPINALQILWVNLVADSFPAISMAFENHVDYLKMRNFRSRRGLLDRTMKMIIFVTGLISSALLLSVYIYLLNKGVEEKIVRTFIFAALGTNTLFVLFSLKSLHKGITEYNPFSNVVMVISALVGLALISFAVYHPALQSLLHTVALPLSYLVGVAAFGILNIALIEVTKALMRPKMSIG